MTSSDAISVQLWFDVESKYEATVLPPTISNLQLWFDVESKYEATVPAGKANTIGCGLMQNQNMKQQ